jgi:hypothetical protein
MYHSFLMILALICYIPIIFVKGLEGIKYSIILFGAIYIILNSKDVFK